MGKRAWAIGLCLVLSGTSFGADFTGKFRAAGDAMVVDLKSSGGTGYTGTITAADQTMTMTATAVDQKISGTFTAGTAVYKFDGTLDGDRLTLVTGGATYQLDRPKTGDGNPLGAGSATAARAAGAAATTDKPGAVTEVIPPDGKVLATNEFGKTLFFEQPDVKDFATAVSTTSAALAKRLGSGVSIDERFEDQKHPGQGAAGFSVTLDGKVCHGSMLCGGTATGAGVAVIYARPGAPGFAMAQLVAALPGRPPMVRHDFPDGTGSIDLPEGWTAISTSLFGDVHIKGPRGQGINLGVSLPICGAQSPLVRVHTQNVQFARTHRMPEPPPLTGILLGEFSTPVEATKTLFPQLDKMNRAAGLPGADIDEFTDVRDVNPAQPTGKAQIMDYLWFRGDKPNQEHVRAIVQAECDDTGYGSWIMHSSGMSAPVDHFDEDAATMYAIIHSIKYDQKMMEKKLAEQLEANKQLTEAQRKQFMENNKNWEARHQAQLDGYAKHNAEWHDQMVVKDHMAKDFVEYVRGYRSVEDNQTGKQVDVDLGHVGEVVDQLNHDDPGRFREIKERDK